MTDRRRKLGPFVEKRSPRGENDRRTPNGTIFRSAWKLARLDMRFHPLGAEANLAREYAQALAAIARDAGIDLRCPTLAVPTPKPAD